MNGAICIDQINGFKCICSEGFTGEFCQNDINKYNATDEFIKLECLKRNCNEKAHNGHCDIECNHFSCQFDGGDCSVEIPNPYKNCMHASYCAHSFKNGHCDEVIYL